MNSPVIFFDLSNDFTKYESYENIAENSLFGKGLEKEIDAAENSLCQNKSITKMCYVVYQYLFVYYEYF